MDGATYKLVTAGAVITNNESVGQNPALFTLNNLQEDKTVINVTAEKLFYDPSETDVTQNPGYGDGKIYFAMRITNIPVGREETVIYARPYYVFMYGDREITVYGDTVFDSYTPQKDVNDGWLEWD